MSYSSLPEQLASAIADGLQSIAQLANNRQTIFDTANKSKRDLGTETYFLNHHRLVAHYWHFIGVKDGIDLSPRQVIGVTVEINTRLGLARSSSYDGFATANPTDLFDITEGKRTALKRALKGKLLDHKFRRELWSEFNDRQRGLYHMKSTTGQVVTRPLPSKPAPTYPRTITGTTYRIKRPNAPSSSTVVVKTPKPHFAFDNRAIEAVERKLKLQAYGVSLDRIAIPDGYELKYGTRLDSYRLVSATDNCYAGSVNLDENGNPTTKPYALNHSVCSEDLDNGYRLILRKIEPTVPRNTPDVHEYPRGVDGLTAPTGFRFRNGTPAASVDCPNRGDYWLTRTGRAILASSSYHKVYLVILEKL